MKDQLLFAVMMDRFTDWVRQETSGILVYVEDIVICAENMELVEEKRK